MALSAGNAFYLEELIRSVAEGRSEVVGLLPARPGPPAADPVALHAALLRLRAEGHLVGTY